MKNTAAPQYNTPSEPQPEASPVAANADTLPDAAPEQATAASAAADTGPQQACEAAPEPAQAQEAPDKPAQVQVLEQQLVEKEARLQATLKQYKEALDDFEQAKARLRRDIGKEIDAGKRAILASLLDVVDNLERAIEASTAAQSASANAAEDSLLSGVSMVRDQFLQKLQSLGVSRVPLLGLPFDPAHSEAVSVMAVPDPAQDGMVIGEIRSCYVMGEYTLRHGMVAVGKCDTPKAHTADEVAATPPEEQKTP